MTDRISNEFNFYQQALGLRQQRQEVLAANIANADTPHYKARDFDFSSALRDATHASDRLHDLRLNMTSARHIPAQAHAADTTLQYRNALQPSLDGNTVDMDVERMHFADNTLRYQTDLNLISQQLRTINAALQQ